MVKEMVEKLTISGEITDELDFQFSTDNPESSGLFTYYPETGMRSRHCFIKISHEEMKKLRDTLNVVLDFTPKEPKSGN